MPKRVGRTTSASGYRSKITMGQSRQPAKRSKRAMVPSSRGPMLGTRTHKQRRRMFKKARRASAKGFF